MPTLSRRKAFLQPRGCFDPAPGGGAPSFPSISGLNLHVSAAALPDNTALSTWTDTSGAGSDLTQATAGNRPKSFTSGGVDALPFVYFDNGQVGDSFLANSSYSTNLRAATFFWVGDVINIDSIQYLINVGSIDTIVTLNQGFMSVYAGGFNVAGRIYSGRRVALVYVLDAASKKLYIDDIASVFSSAALAATSVTGIALGDSGGVYRGRNYEFAAWNKAANSTEVGQLLTYAADAGNYGTGLSQATPTGCVVFDGDSTPFGYGGTRGRNLPYYLSINSSWYTYNFAVPGQQITAMSADQSEVNALANSTNWLVIEAGYNDLGALASGATVEGRLNTYCTAAISAGFSKSKIVVMTLSTSGTPTERDNANTLIRANYTGYAGWLIDQAADSQLGVNTGSGFKVAGNFADGVHKNDAGLVLQAALIRSTVAGLP